MSVATRSLRTSAHTVPVVTGRRKNFRRGSLIRNESKRGPPDTTRNQHGLGHAAKLKEHPEQHTARQRWRRMP